MKEWLKIFQKLPKGYQKLIADALERILSGNTTGLDIDVLGAGLFRCRIGKYRIIYEKKSDGSYEVVRLGTRGDVYKK